MRIEGDRLALTMTGFGIGLAAGLVTLGIIGVVVVLFLVFGKWAVVVPAAFAVVGALLGWRSGDV